MRGSVSLGPRVLLEPSTRKNRQTETTLVSSKNPVEGLVDRSVNSVPSGTLENKGLKTDDILRSYW